MRHTVGRATPRTMLAPLTIPAYRFTALAVALSIITVVPGSDNVTEQDRDFRRQLPDMIDLLCPYDKTCRGGEPRLQLNKGMGSCCTACSCEDSCGLTESCCYPEQAAIRYFDRSQQQCQIPSTTSEDYRGILMTGKRFYMITSRYGNDRSDTCETGSVTCGENEAASALGSLYPVSSKTTTLIYKNEQCARCDGVARSDMISWQAVMTCMLYDDRFDTLLQSLETGRVHTSCWLDFFYPGQESEINVHQCYEGTTRSCRYEEGQSYDIPSYLNMTEDDVRSACVAGPQAQYRDFYNVFCFLCSYGFFKDDEQCVKKSLGDRAASPGSFSAFIDPSLSDNKAFAQRTNVETKVRIKIACKRRDGPQTDADDCRPVLCSSGKIRLGSACVYPADTMFSRNVEVAVKLYPGNNRQISPLIEQLQSYLEQGTDWRKFIKVQGLQSWYLRYLCYHDDTHQATNNGSVGFFWMKLTLEQTKSQSYAKLLANINKFMTRKCEFIEGMTVVPLEQRFSEFEDVGYDRTINSYKPRDVDNQNLELSCTMFGHPSRSPSIQVTKMFFCDQVALKPEEYVLDMEWKKLYVNETGRVFGPAEYSLGYDASGEPEPRLCLEDTDFVLVPQQHPASPSCTPAYNNWLIFALVVIAELI